MSVSRRQFVVAGLSVLAGGCASQSVSTSQRPGVSWPTNPATASVPPSVITPRVPATPTPPAITPPPVAPIATLRPIARSRWAGGGPKLDRINPLGRITRMTVHHEGASPVWFTDIGSTAKRLEAVRQAHLQRGWADIGYHFVVDRAGQIWEARDLRYQGAHVSNQNENNLGIMVLGNFGEQTPSAPQLTTLRTALIAFSRQYSIPVGRIYTHREIGQTSCPGNSLQSYMVGLRARNLA